MMGWVIYLLGVLIDVIVLAIVSEDMVRLPQVRTEKIIIALASLTFCALSWFSFALVALIVALTNKGTKK